MLFFFFLRGRQEDQSECGPQITVAALLQLQQFRDLHPPTDINNIEENDACKESFK